MQIRGLDGFYCSLAREKKLGYKTCDTVPLETDSLNISMRKFFKTVIPCKKNWPKLMFKVVKATWLMI